MVEPLEVDQSKLFLLLRRILLEQPPAINENNYPNYVPINIITMFGAINHLGWLFFFWYIEVYPLAIFNILSVALWLFAIFLCRKGHLFSSTAVYALEVILHQVLCVMIIGWGAGFQYFLILVPIGFYILPQGKNFFKVASVIISFSSFAILNFYFINAKPVVTLPLSMLNALNYANIFFIFVVGPVSVFYFSSKMDETEMALKDKNTILINIEKNLKKYLPKQLVETITTGGQEAIESITTHHRKKLTLFFSDIKDFTKITDALEPEDMANLLNEYLTAMNIIINEYRGTLSQVIGDGLYVFFGAPVSSNDRDHAIRCVKMAVDMQQKMKDLNRRWFDRGVDEVLQIRCGVNNGMATVGGYGSSERKEYTAMGMQVNIAARIEQACKPGSVLISHTTWALVKDEFSCSEQGHINVKGVQRPLRVYNVDAVV